MLDSALHLASARYVLGVLPSWELPGVADAAIDRGLYSQALGELATTRESVMSDAGPLFERALRQLGIPLPSREAAAWLLLRHHIGRIADRLVPPQEGLRLILEEVYYPAELHEKARQCVGDSHGLQYLIGCYYGYDDVEQRPDEVSFKGKYGENALRELDHDVVRLAAEWVTNYCEQLGLVGLEDSTHSKRNPEDAQ